MKPRTIRSNNRCWAFLQVAAGAERLVAGSGHDDRATGQGIGVDRIEEGQQITPHPGVHRVGDLWPVEGQQCEPVALVLDPQRLVIVVHRFAPGQFGSW